MEKKEIVEAINKVLNLELKTLSKMSKGDLEQLYVLLSNPSELAIKLITSKTDKYKDRTSNWIEGKIEKMRALSDMLKRTTE